MKLELGNISLWQSSCDVHAVKYQSLFPKHQQYCANGKYEAQHKD